MPDLALIPWPTTIHEWVVTVAGLLAIGGAVRGRARIGNWWRAVPALIRRFPWRLIQTSTLEMLRSSDTRASLLNDSRFRDPPAFLTTLMVGLADPPDDTTEPYLEWPHIAVQNVSDARLIGVRAELLITGRYGTSGTVLRLRWDPDESDAITLEPRETRTLSLCMRSREPNRTFITSRRGIRVPLDQWVCYVTHEGFLLSGEADLRVRPGDEADLRVRVPYGDRGEARAWFRVYVPRVHGKPLWVVPLPAARSEA